MQISDRGERPITGFIFDPVPGLFSGVELRTVRRQVDDPPPWRQPGVAESWVVPCREGRQLRAQLHNVLRGDAIKEHAITLVGNDRPRGFRTPEELQDSRHPCGGISGEMAAQEVAYPAEVVAAARSMRGFSISGTLASPRETTTRCRGWP